MLVQAFLENAADRFPDKVGLVCDEQRLTYGQLEERANRLANTLLARGVSRGDRVAIFLPNCVEAVVAIFAVLKAGAVFLVINHTTKQQKLQYILNDCRASAIITSARFESLVRGLLPRIPPLAAVVITGPDRELAAPFLSYEAAQRGCGSSRPRRVNIDLDLACLVYTSGSTGEPKGVMSDHSNVVFAANAITTYLGNLQDDIVIGLLPLSFDYGLYQLLMTVSFGGTLVLEKGFTYPAAVLARMVEEKVTGLPGVPTLFALLLQTELSGYDLSSLRYITNTAASLPSAHALELRRRFPWVRIYSMYGLTETKRTLYLPPEHLDQRPDSVGIPIPGTEVWIESEDGARLGPGQVGELVVRGRHVMRGYWGDKAATAQRFRPGSGTLQGERLCYSGDLFRQDADGFYYFVSRKDDIIKSRGEKIAPKEVEDTIYALDGIVEVAVVGLPDPMFGQIVKAFVVARDRELTEAKVLAHCRAHLEDFMIPAQVEFRHELPKTASGKIAKSHLN